MKAIGYIYKIVIDNPESKLNQCYYIGQKLCRKHYPGKVVSNYFGSGTILMDWFKKHLQRPSNKCSESLASTIGVKREVVQWAFSIEELNTLEKEYIAKYLHDPYCLNIKEGGRNPACAEETKQKISKALTGKKLSPEHIQACSNGLKGLPSHNKGKAMSEEQKEKLRIASTGKHHTEWSRFKLSLAHRGKKASEQTRKNISESKKGEKNPRYNKPQTEKQKQALQQYIINGVYNKGKTFEESYGVEKAQQLRQLFSQQRKGCKYWNNGKINKYCKECPGPEWVRGRLSHKRKEI